MNFINDMAVKALSHPYVVLIWWICSLASIVLFLFQRDIMSGTLALSILALAYSSAIAERQLRYEGDDKKRDQALHGKLDTLVEAIPEADNALIGSEK